ncbi:hypothetical protein [Streptomyces flaveolus]|uniref:hypothetical protein n=1 Tax=Streptomyces flaveolus TaxID=67297 RepID=UPI003406446C
MGSIRSAGNGTGVEFVLAVALRHRDDLVGVGVGGVPTAVAAGEEDEGEQRGQEHS